MDTIVPDPMPTLRQVVRFIELLGIQGVAGPQIQHFIDDIEFRTRVVRVMQQESNKSLIDISGEFDQDAMKLLIEHLFDYDIRRMGWLKEGYALTNGCQPMDLAATSIVKDLLDGLSPLHVAVAVLRSGLLGGKKVAPQDVAVRLNISTTQVSKIRSEATRYIKARQRRLYPFARWVTMKPAEYTGLIEVTVQGSPIENMQFTTRTYNSLVREGIHTVGELASKSRYELAEIRNVGSSSLDEIEAALARHGFHLGYLS